MTAPRRSFGPNPPGRLAGTMLRALTAELSDPGRYARSKQYARDGAVVDIDVAPGVARAEVRGTRYDPYVTMLYAQPLPADELDAARDSAVSTALLIPARTEIAASCTCPDGDTHVADWCKHALATLLVLADEVTIEPEILHRWRSGTALDAPARIVAEAPAVDVLAAAMAAPAPIPGPRRVTPPARSATPPGPLGEALASALEALTG